MLSYTWLAMASAIIMVMILVVIPVFAALAIESLFLGIVFAPFVALLVVAPIAMLGDIATPSQYV